MNKEGDPRVNPRVREVTEEEAREEILKGLGLGDGEYNPDGHFERERPPTWQERARRDLDVNTNNTERTN